ncbi:MAG: ferritin-like domain-containing protein, partial [Nannocystaceae bacterium]
TTGDATTGDATGDPWDTSGGDTWDTDGEPIPEMCAGYYVDGPPEFGDGCGGGYGQAIGAPEVKDEMCCFTVDWPEICCGRPFSVGEGARVAAVAATRAWLGERLPTPQLGGLDAATRERLAAAWTADGLAEHASVASFARFILELLAVGAPAELVSAAQRALAEEIEHARLCFALASAYRGAPVGPGPLAIDAALDGGGDLRSIVARALVEGCIGETLAALQAGVAAASTGDPAVAAALQSIADDELEHAALAWSFVRWAIDAGGLADAEGLIAAAIDAAEAEARAPIEVSADAEGDALAVYGRLDAGAEQRLRRDGARTVILPALRGLAADLAARRGATSVRAAALRSAAARA